MKNRIVQILAVLLIGTGGVTMYNHTGEDIDLQNGEVLVSQDLPKHKTKTYKERNVEDSLTIYIHHTVTPNDFPLENISSHHINELNWPGIAYHIAIYDNGDIHFLNDIEKKTYHNSEDNTYGIGVAAIGNFQEHPPTPELINSIKEVCNSLCKTLKIKGIKGHRDSKLTYCPGDNLYNELKAQGVFF